MCNTNRCVINDNVAAEQYNMRKTGNYDCHILSIACLTRYNERKKDNYDYQCVPSDSEVVRRLQRLNLAWIYPKFSMNAA